MTLSRRHISRSNTYEPQYGSDDDTRIEDITQLHSIPSHCADCDDDIPPLSNVLPAAGMPDYKPDKQRYFLELRTTTLADNVRRQELPFKAQSILIDNLSNQWLYVPSINRYIPPYIYGVVTPLIGVDSITLLFQAPPGYVQAAIIVGQPVDIVAYIYRYDPVTGQTFVGP